MRIIHATTVHPRDDVRVRMKEVETLAGVWPDQISLFVQDGLGDEKISQPGYEIHDTGPPEKTRLLRMTKGAARMFFRLIRSKPSIVHFHDPELLPWMLLLRLWRIKVIYDVHENAGETIQSKKFIPALIRTPLAFAVRLLERLSDTLCSAIVVVTPSIGESFGSSAIVVQNFPFEEEFDVGHVAETTHRQPHFAYVGRITRIRGVIEMVKALELLDIPEVRLQVVGAFGPGRIEDETSTLPGWESVVFHGWTERAVVADILANVRAGLVLFHPLPNHTSSQPNKLFEYMAAGLPLIASDFPLWRDLIEKEKCGVLVNPESPESIAEGMQWVLDNPDEARSMGLRGRQAVRDTYNWAPEARKLIGLYKELGMP